MNSSHLLDSAVLVMRAPAHPTTPTRKADKLTANTKNYLRHLAVTFTHEVNVDTVTAIAQGRLLHPKDGPSLGFVVARNTRFRASWFSAPPSFGSPHR